MCSKPQPLGINQLPSSLAGLRHCRERGRIAQGFASPLWSSEIAGNPGAAELQREKTKHDNFDNDILMPKKCETLRDPTTLNYLNSTKASASSFLSSKFDVPICTHDATTDCKAATKPMSWRRCIRFFGAQRAAEALKLQRQHREEDGRMICSGRSDPTAPCTLSNCAFRRRPCYWILTELTSSVAYRIL